jgi:peroxiredoxin 2/4
MLAHEPLAVQPLRMGDMVPHFTARTTMGQRKLDDYRGRWLVLFSHPADFTPVCTSEFVALAKAAPRFEAMNCALLGLSVDSLYAHIAWVKAIQQVFGVDVPFPIIEDPGLIIGKAFGMIDESASDTATIRGTYFIDPGGILRAFTSYPHNVGRSVEEMLRMVSALQIAARGDVLTPEGWQPGQPLIAPPAADIRQTDAAPDWFCRQVTAS